MLCGGFIATKDEILRQELLIRRGNHKIYPLYSVGYKYTLDYILSFLHQERSNVQKC